MYTSTKANAVFDYYFCLWPNGNARYKYYFCLRTNGGGMYQHYFRWMDEC